MAKQSLVTVIVAVALGSGIGFGMGAASRPQPADAATSNAEVVRQLKAVNTQLKAVNAGIKNVSTQVGTQADKGTVRWLLTTICDYTASVDCGP